MSADTTADDVRATLDRLEGAGLVVVDDDTEEVLVLDFIRQDKGYSNPKRRPTILDAAAEITSVSLRQALAMEFAAVGLPVTVLGVEPPPSGPPAGPRGSDRQSDSPSDRQSTRVPQTPPEPAAPDPETTAESDNATNADTSAVDNVFPQVNSLSDRQPDALRDRQSPSERSVVTQGPYIGGIHTPQSSSSSRTPAAPAAVARLIATTGANDDETRHVIDEIRRQHKPRNLAAYVRTMAANGDLHAVLADIRNQRQRRADSEARRATLAARLEAEDEHDRQRDLDQPAATPEQAAAARAQLRAFLAGQGPKPGHGDPATIGEVLRAVRPA
jgi:hypothetical protein